MIWGFFEKSFERFVNIQLKETCHSGTGQLRKVFPCVWTNVGFAGCFDKSFA